VGFNDYIYISLKTPISCETLCNRLNSFISSMDTKDCVLEIGLKKIGEYESTIKLGYINSSNPPITTENNHEHKN
jgi:hypothetical protein